MLNTLLRRLASESSVSVEEISEDTGLSRSFITDSLKLIGVSLKNNVVEDGPTDLVIKSWMKGFDIVQLALSLGWHELEKLCSAIFQKAGYETSLNYRFKQGGKRYEIDLLALKKDTLFAVDCKRWSRLRASGLRKAALMQRERAKALAGHISKRGLSLPLHPIVNRVKIIPLVASIYSPPIKMHGGVPIVNIYELRVFLAEVEASIEGVEFFEAVVPRLV